MQAELNWTELNVFIITSDKPQMKLHEQFINDKVWTIKLGLLLDSLRVRGPIYKISYDNLTIILR